MKSTSTNRTNRVCLRGDKSQSDRKRVLDSENGSGWLQISPTQSINPLEFNLMTHSNSGSNLSTSRDDEPSKQLSNRQLGCHELKGTRKNLSGSANVNTNDGSRINASYQNSQIDKAKRVNLCLAEDSNSYIDGTSRFESDFRDQPSLMSCCSLVCEGNSPLVGLGAIYPIDIKSNDGGVPVCCKESTGLGCSLPIDRVATKFIPPIDDDLVKFPHWGICETECRQYSDGCNESRQIASRHAPPPAYSSFKNSAIKPISRAQTKFVDSSIGGRAPSLAREISVSDATSDPGEISVATDVGIAVNTNLDCRLDEIFCAQSSLMTESTISTNPADFNTNTINRLFGKGRLKSAVKLENPPTGNKKHHLDRYKLFSSVNKVGAREDLIKVECNPVAPSSVSKQSNTIIKPPGLPIGKVYNSSESEKNRDINRLANVTATTTSIATTNTKTDEKVKETAMVATINMGAGIAIKSDGEVSFEAKSSGMESNNSLNRRMVWKSLAIKYGMMSNRGSTALGQGQLMTKMRQSCCFNLMLSSLKFMFPIFSTMKDYSFPGDLVADILAGFTVAILHIPQGMAYGLLAGVDPIYGLYVSLIPVLVMAFMSKSYHVSYGTFAVISMLLFNCQESVRASIRQEHHSSLEYLGAVNQTETRIYPTVGEGFRHGAGKVLSREQADNLMNSNEQSGVLLTMTNNHKQQVHYPTQEILRSLVPRLVNRKDFQSITSDDAQPIRESALDWRVPESLIGSAAIPSISSVNPDIIVAADEPILPSSMEILTCICLVVGVIQISMAIMRLGFLSLMFSDQLVSGFTTASAIHVMTSQLGSLFDVQIARPTDGLFKVAKIWYMFALKMYDGFNQYTGLITLVSLVFLLFIKELVEPPLKRRCKSIPCIPSELILMVVLITCSSYWRFASDYGILIVGKVPTGLPVPQLPKLDLVPAVLEDALMIAVISFAMNLSLAQSYAKKHNLTLDPNQELFAVGATNVVSSFFSCFPCASSLSRSAVQSSLNVKSQLCPLISCAVVLSVICYFAPIFHDLPRSTLSCIIVVALRSIILQVRDFFENWRLSKLDALIWAVTFISVLAFDVTYGLIVGIIASLVKVFYRLLTPTYSVLGRLPGTDIFVDKDAFLECKEIERVKIFKFNSPLCYLNRVMFKSGIKKMVKSNQHTIIDPSLIMQQHMLKQGHLNITDSRTNYHFDYLVVDCSGLAYCDFSGASALAEIIDELGDSKITVFLAACPLKLINMFERMNKPKILEENLYPTIATTIDHIEHIKSKGSAQVLQVSVG